MTTLRTQSKTFDRYAQHWDWVSRMAKGMTGGMCSYPGCCRKAYQTHHAVYLEKDDRGNLAPIRGKEKPGIHVFPLCKFHHSRNHPAGAHHPFNWEKGIIPPDRLDAKQKPEFYRKLLAGFKEKREKAENDRAENKISIM